MPTVDTYEIVDHGQDGESYFPGCGVAFTSFDTVFTGIGDTPGEALDDALEQAAIGGDCDFTREQSEAIAADWLNDKEWADKPLDTDAEGNDEWHHYVSIRVRFVKGKD